MKLAQDYKNIASLYTGGKHIQENFAKIDAYLSLFCKKMGRRINLQNKNILQTNVYGNFILTENNILNKKTGIEHLGSF